MTRRYFAVLYVILVGAMRAFVLLSSWSRGVNGIGSNHSQFPFDQMKMAESLSTALLVLEQVVATTRGDDVAAIDAAVSEVMEFGSPECIGVLLRLLSDDALYDEGMFSLIHAAESFDDTTYVRSFLEVVPKLVEGAPAWASILIMRVINSESARAVLVADVRQSSVDIKGAVVRLLDSINNEDESFIAKTSSSLEAAKN